MAVNNRIALQPEVMGDCLYLYVDSDKGRPLWCPFSELSYTNYSNSNALLSTKLMRDLIEWNGCFADAHFGEFECPSNDWAWDNFRERGLVLARRLKSELGDSFDVLYRRASCDPLGPPWSVRRIEQRTKVLDDGTRKEIEIRHVEYQYTEIESDGNTETITFCFEIELE